MYYKFYYKNLQIDVIMYVISGFHSPNKWMIQIYFSDLWDINV